MESLVIEFWHWWIAAVVLLVLEVFAPGSVFLWMSTGAGLTGLLLLLAPETAWEYQLLAFAVLTVASAVAWRAYLRHRPIETDQPALNRRGEQYVGRVFNLDEAIVNGTGKIRVDDTTWKVEGADLPLDAKVRVTGVDGTVLTVEPE